MIYQAHKGVSTENPENTMPAFISAVEQGYDVIELDVSVTKDIKFVTLHDKTINRTARQKNGELISEPIEIKDINYVDLLEYDFGIWLSDEFANTKIPLFEDVLLYAKQNGVKIKIDNKYQKFNQLEREKFFKLLKSYENIACLTCSTVEELKSVKEIFPDMYFHYDGPVTEDILEEISKFLPKEQLTVWLPHKNPKTSWVKVEFANERLASMIKKYAQLGVWILTEDSHLEEAKTLGAEIIETNGELKPILHNNIFADMHTHSKFSHDSVCEIEDMCLSQIKKGTKIFAVTDHCDVFSFKDYDVFTPINDSYNEIKLLNQKYGENCLLLSGVEISEGFWFPEQYKKIHNLAHYDVIIGSVHCVKCDDLEIPYSKINFSKLSKEKIYEYLNCYFNDVITMLEKTDFDILAHLTCPLRYIFGKFGIDIDLRNFDEQISKILKTIIDRNIALEVNTSAFSILKDFMPNKEIIKKYYDMGGRLVTIGSDAHIAENASIGFEKAIKILKEIGFENICYFKYRKVNKIHI